MVRLKDVKIDIPLFLDKNRDEFYQCWSLPMAYAMQKEFEEAMFNPELPTLPRSLWNGWSIERPGPYGFKEGSPDEEQDGYISLHYGIQEGPQLYCIDWWIQEGALLAIRKIAWDHWGTARWVCSWRPHGKHPVATRAEKNINEEDRRSQDTVFIDNSHIEEISKENNSTQPQREDYYNC